MSADADRFRRNWQDEIDGAAIYAAIADSEADPELARVFRRLAATESQHAEFWAERLRRAGVDPGRPRPGWRSRLLIRLSRYFGGRLLVPTMAAREREGHREYTAQPEAVEGKLAADERSHALLLAEVTRLAPPAAAAGAIARLEGRHRAVGGNALRAAVLGANDGLVSNFSLVMGVAGADVSNRGILITGLAGLLAGAFSMAMGEWISVRSSRELYQHQLEIEAGEIEEFPEAERAELALLYQVKGLSETEATALADRVMSDADRALGEMAREELGIDPAELGGSPGVAAASSFAFFVAGAIVPVLPFIFLDGDAAIATSVVLSAAALFLIGAAITVMTGRSALFSGLRQLAIGVAAAAATFGIGSLIGASV